MWMCLLCILKLLRLSGDCTGASLGGGKQSLPPSVWPVALVWHHQSERIKNYFHALLFKKKYFFCPIFVLFCFKSNFWFSDFCPWFVVGVPQSEGWGRDQKICIFVENGNLLHGMAPAAANREETRFLINVWWIYWQVNVCSTRRNGAAKIYCVSSATAKPDKDVSTSVIHC